MQCLDSKGKKSETLQTILGKISWLLSTFWVFCKTALYIPGGTCSTWPPCSPRGRPRASAFSPPPVQTTKLGNQAYYLKVELQERFE